jgi:hypothetical protein
MPFDSTPERNTPPAGPTTPYPGVAGRGGRSRSSGHGGGSADWFTLLRRVERKRRLATRSQQGANPTPTIEYYSRATYVSFILDGIDVAEEDVREALGHAPAGARPVLRSRQGQRLRNHAAILHHIENNLREGQPVTPDHAVRWYTAISAGLSMNGLSDVNTTRLADVVRRVNSPQSRLQPALRDIAAAHANLLADPLVPGFNGILARLLLRYHLGRCRLPAVIFDPALDRRPSLETPAMTRRLVELLDQSYDALLGRRR